MGGRKTNLPAGFASKTNFQILSGVPAGQKLNATTEWNLGIQDLADSIDENYERLVLNWTNDIIADQVLALGQYIDFNDVVYRVTTPYDVSDPKTFTPANFQIVGDASGKIDKASPSAGAFTGVLDLSLKQVKPYSDYDITSGIITFSLGGNEIPYGIDHFRIISDGETAFATEANLDAIFSEQFNLPANRVLPEGTFSIYCWKTFDGATISIPAFSSATPSFPLALANFNIKDANKDRVYFDTNQAPIGTTHAGFTLTTPSKTITGIVFNTGFTTGHYLTISAAYDVGDTLAKIAYDGTDDWTGTGGALAAFTATAIENNIGLTQLDAVTLGSVVPDVGQVTIAVTNPNSGNEDQNQLYYKLNTEPTIWTTGAVMATSGTSVIQTGLTDDLLYNFRMVAEGDDITFSDSPDSNIVNGTAGEVDPADLVIARMANLSGSEETAIRDFVDAEVIAGTWDLIDEFYCFALNSTDWLTGFRSKTCTNQGATQTTGGATFNGSTQYIESNWIPSVDGVQYQLDDALVAAFIYAVDSGGNAYALGCADGNNDHIVFIDAQSSNNFQYDLHGTGTVVDIGDRTSKTLIAIERTSSINQALYEDGILVDSDSGSTSIDLPTVEIYFGARNGDGTADVHFDGIISTVTLGAGATFDHSAHNTNVRQLLTDLGLTP